MPVFHGSKIAVRNNMTPNCEHHHAVHENMIQYITLQALFFMNSHMKCMGWCNVCFSLGTEKDIQRRYVVDDGFHKKLVKPLSVNNIVQSCRKMDVKEVFWEKGLAYVWNNVIRTRSHPESNNGKQHTLQMWSVEIWCWGEVEGEELRDWYCVGNKWLVKFTFITGVGRQSKY